MSKKSTQRSRRRTSAPPPRPPLLQAVIRGFLRFLEPDLPVTEFSGPGKYDTEVKDVSHHQPALELICGGRTSKAQKIPTTATITPDARAACMRVQIEGKTVGQLKPADAKFLQKQLDKADLGPCAVRVSALILGGRRKKNGEAEDFVVRVNLPPKPQKKNAELSEEIS